jgi:COP9 signalosome complex subunit 1
LALIAALCTLATGSRERIRRILLDRPSFRTALGDEQGWIVDLVRALLDAEYSELGPLLRKAEVCLSFSPIPAIRANEE